MNRSAGPGPDSFELQALRIAEEHGVELDSDILNEIHEIRLEYDISVRQRIDRPSQARDDLEELKTHLRVGLKLLRQMDEALAYLLQDVYLSTVRDGSRLNDDIGALARLEAHTSLAQLRLKQGGRPAKTERNVLFTSLAKQYERATGRKFVPGKRDNWRGEKFVTDMAKLVDRDLSEVDLRNGCKAAADLLNWERAQRTEKKEDEIQETLVDKG